MPTTDITASPPVPEMGWIGSIVRLMDSRFRIPGTRIRFGLDSVIGLVPYAGDLLGFGVSAFLILAMVRNGASGMVVARMIGNVMLDTVVGSIPILGDIFDVAFKANRRNYKLLQEHYEEGKHRGSAWPVIIGVLVALLFVFALTVYLVYKVAIWIGDLLFGF